MRSIDDYPLLLFISFPFSKVIKMVQRTYLLGRKRDINVRSRLVDTREGEGRMN